ncbi:hypothetical protein ACIQF6_27955 [Kitasatospora sp. NPDC092948]|uniref:hypothetical protein n=1 Tax=Kitasatospora sp. NPDC092948 TaxID=3364088 RepID=UPI00381BD470
MDGRGGSRPDQSRARDCDRDHHLAIGPPLWADSGMLEGDGSGEEVAVVKTAGIRIGESYLVRVPQHLPYDRYPPGDTMASVLMHWRRFISSGTEFELTVTALPEPEREHMVAGLIVKPHSGVRVLLTDDQAEELGLPAGVGYVVDGSLTDLTGAKVDLMSPTPMTVPARWLHPLPDDRGQGPP